MKTLHNKLILVIDDDAGMLRALDKVLTGEGAVVTRASWAGDAVEILTAREKDFDLVITDLRMPFVTGLTVVFAVHKIYPGLPVIVLSAFGAPDVKAECFQQGAAAFLEKPLDTQELLAAVEKVFKSNQTGTGLVPGAPGETDVSHENIETPKNRLQARHPETGRQGCGASVGTGGTGKRKEPACE